MKTLVVLATLVAVAIAGPTFRGDTDLDVTKIKRSPSLHHHHIATPVHVTPVHHTYVQPVIPHHLGLKKPVLVHHPYGHGHGHLFRSDDEKLETHSAESKESKTKCMKEMEAKCEDDVTAKSNALQETKIEDIDDDVPNMKVAQRLQMAQEAVDMLRKQLELSHKNSKSMSVPFKHEESEADKRMHADIEAAKVALERMQFHMGNMESMNVHARQFKNSEVHDVNLEFKSDEERLAQWKDAIENIQKNVELVRNIEDSFQNNDHSEKSAALEKSSSFNHEMKEENKFDQHHGGHSGKSAVLEKSSSLKHEMIEDHKLDAIHKGLSEKSAVLEKSSSLKHEMIEDHKIDAIHKGLSEKSAALEKSSSLKHEMIQGHKLDATHKELSEKSAALEKSSSLKQKIIDDHKLNAMHTGPSEKSASLDTTISFKHEINNAQKHDALALKGEKTADVMMARDMETKSTDKKTSWQAREPEKFSKSEMETSASTLSESKTSLPSASEQKSFRSETSHKENISDFPTASKLIAEHNNVKGFKNDERSVKTIEDKNIGKSKETVSHPSLKSSESLDMKSTLFEQEKMVPVVDTTTFMKSAEQSQLEKHSKNVQHGSEGHTALRGENAHEINQQRDHLKAKESESMKHHELSNSAMHSTDAHEIMMKSSDQMTGQSHQSAVAVKAEHVTGHSEKLLHTSQGAHGKSAEDGLFAPIEMPAFKQSLVPSIGSKSWKGLQSSRGAYGSGLALGGSYGAGYGSGSGAVGVFPNARVGGCAIPLLLSCSPSVVTGSLAKSHGYAAPSYAASGYRTDNSNTLSKRDITKISRPLQKRTPNKDLQQKTILITDKL